MPEPFHYSGKSGRFDRALVAINWGPEAASTVRFGYIRRMPPAPVPLGRAFPSRYGAPVIERVDPAIFRRRYFTHCLDCTFCQDACCDHGVDVDLVHAERIRAHADDLEVYTGIPRERWFTGQWEEDPEVPGGITVRTRVEDGHCVFLNRTNRGCLLHAYCLDRGIDYHELKSMVDCLFPITFYEGILGPAEDVDDDTLVCLGTGPTLFEGLREELLYYFGQEFVEALDEIAQVVAAAPTR